VALTGLATTADAFHLVNQLIFKQVAAGSIIKLGIDVGATATSQTIAVDLIGYLI